eukprot:Gb_33556 [translate_table: standard]
MMPPLFYDLASPTLAIGMVAYCPNALQVSEVAIHEVIRLLCDGPEALLAARKDSHVVWASRTYSHIDTTSHNYLIVQNFHDSWDGLVATRRDKLKQRCQAHVVRICDHIKIVEDGLDNHEAWRPTFIANIIQILVRDLLGIWILKCDMEWNELFDAKLRAVEVTNLAIDAGKEVLETREKMQELLEDLKAIEQQLASTKRALSIFNHLLKEHNILILVLKQPSERK